GSGGPRGAGPRSAVVRGLPADPVVSLAGVPGSGVDFVRGVVPGPAGGGASGADRRCRAAQPDQPARGQGEDVELQEETPRASPRTTFEEDLCRISSYALLNGIGPSPGSSRPSPLAATPRAASAPPRGPRPAAGPGRRPLRPACRGGPRPRGPGRAPTPGAALPGV